MSTENTAGKVDEVKGQLSIMLWLLTNLALSAEHSYIYIVADGMVCFATISRSDAQKKVRRRSRCGKCRMCKTKPCGDCIHCKLAADCS